MMKKGFCLFLAILIVLSSGVHPSTFAETDESIETFSCVKGLVESVDDAQLSLRVNGTLKTVMIRKNAVIMDAQTGQSESFDEIKEGDWVVVYENITSKDVTTQWLLTHLKANENTPKWITVDEMTALENDKLNVLDKSQNLLVTLQMNKPLYGSGASFDDIKIGSKLLVWYDAIAMSVPAFTYAQKVALWSDVESDVKVIWPEEMEVRPVKTTQERLKTATLEIGGKKIDLGKYPMTLQNGNVMVPVRTVGEATGFSVVWNPKINVIHMKKGPILSNVILGQDGYFKAKGAILGIIRLHDFGAKPQILNGTIYVPVALFNLLFEDNQAVQLKE